MKIFFALACCGTLLLVGFSNFNNKKSVADGSITKEEAKSSLNEFRYLINKISNNYEEYRKDGVSVFKHMPQNALIVNDINNVVDSFKQGSPMIALSDYLSLVANQKIEHNFTIKRELFPKKEKKLDANNKIFWVTRTRENKINGKKDELDLIIHFYKKVTNDIVIKEIDEFTDVDNDEIEDIWEDDCPVEKGFPNTRGCPDDDRDGFINSEDDCPSDGVDPNVKRVKGCPIEDPQIQGGGTSEESEEKTGAKETQQERALRKIIEHVQEGKLRGTMLRDTLRKYQEENKEDPKVYFEAEKWIRDSKDLPSRNNYQNFIFVKGGEFTMGDNGEDDAPEHRVKVNDFFIEPHEVTNSQYVEFLNNYKSVRTKDSDKLMINLAENPEIIKNGKTYDVPKEEDQNKPVRFVSWYGADAYAKYNGLRLPTEAEWEYVASLSGKFRIFPSSNTLDNAGWYRGNSYGELRSVYDTIGLKSSNGVFHLAGNVSEWCSDWYRSAFYDSEDAYFNPQGPKSGARDLNVYRGGAYDEGLDKQKVYKRRKKGREATSADIGFRCVRSNKPVIY